MYDTNMINELATALRGETERSHGNGLRLNFAWLMGVLDGDAGLCEQVLERAGFEPPDLAIWSTGNGAWSLERVTYPPIFADKLTDILDHYDD
jgi:hypothetical protein